MKVAVVGLSRSTNHLAPWTDPGWAIWGLPWDSEYWPRMDRYFEMHDRSLLETEGSGRNDDYWERLREIGPVYMQQHWPDIPQSIAYPLDAVQKTVFGGFHRRWDQPDWYNSSPAYMIALAIHEGAEIIGIWGVDVLDDSEFNYESNCLDYLIGKAEGMGIEVITPEGPTALGKFRGEGIKLGTLEPEYNKRYGYI